MKKTILATTLALGLGVTGITAGQDAEASSYDLNKKHLLKQHKNPEALNASALHEGQYDYNFNHKEFNYDFNSDGTNYAWAYQSNGNAQAEVPAQEQAAAPSVKEETQNVEQNNYTYTEEVQQPVQNASCSSCSTRVEQPSAPAPQSTGGSTKSQFLAAGGTEAMWNSIVLPESSGNPNAVSPNGYQGLGQTKESWGTGSVADQTSGMLNYAEERYGSIDAAIQFREANNWW
ncbi:hypothetical protein [Jeotgalicoccus sp. WY2]|uniref:aggregation-promoting factor C-terminal-like domain-containing protein n=1 Tax=Jeotgalicoccus sp. WY2 TaxID=2708346 RepID=UPI001BD6A013|nr:hypothetical protein [Jeotgalicoccus sp. WY2]